MPGVTTAYQNGVHGSRPAANAGCILYACSTHSLIYRSDGSSWTTWMTIGSTTTTVASDAIWDAAGDLAVGSGADTAAKLTLGASGKVPISNGSTLVYDFPPGHEWAYVEFTSQKTITNTSEGAADTIVSAGSVTYDGAPVMVECYIPYSVPDTTAANRQITYVLHDSSALGEIGYHLKQSAATERVPLTMKRRYTPSAAAHTIILKAFVNAGTGLAVAGAGGAGVDLPGYIRVTKV